MNQLNKIAASEIRRIRAYEKKARRLRNELSLLETQWFNRISSVRQVYPQAWKDYCNENGLFPDYTFADTLC